MVNEDKLKAAFEAVEYMEEMLGHDVTGNHEIYFDADVSADGAPYVAVTVSGDDGVNKLTSLFGDSILYKERGAEEVIVPVVIKPLGLGSDMN